MCPRRTTAGRAPAPNCRAHARVCATTATRIIGQVADDPAHRPCDGDGMAQPRLITRRLALHPVAPRHAGLIAALDADPEVMRYVGGPVSDRALSTASHQRRLEMGGRVEGLGHWAAFGRDPTRPGRDCTEEPERFVGLLMLPPAHGPDQPNDRTVADLGYRLRRHAWGHGYGREAATALLAHAFDTVGLSRVIAQTRIDNAASRRLLEAVGLQHVRTFRSLDSGAGDPLDVEYEMRAEDWRSVTARSSQRRGVFWAAVEGRAPRAPCGADAGLQARGRRP
jgi:RimJ/RimL family protein N-acetyltransferase